jgi:hypothetical protein
MYSLLFFIYSGLGPYRKWDKLQLANFIMGYNLERCNFMKKNQWMLHLIDG